MLKAMIAFLGRLLPKPDFEFKRSTEIDLLEERKLKVRTMIEGRLL